ncbi:WXG100 family type VII secretion target [Mycolicibacterium brisbanense]
MGATPAPMVAVTAPDHPTAQFAQQLPGFDASAAIAAQEQNLREYLNRPVHEILAQLGYPAPDATPAQPPAQPPGPMDPTALIQPITDALGTLGTGMFQALDPTTMFQGISQAFDASSGNLTTAMGSLAGNWEGAGATSAAAKTVAAMKNGTDLSTQAQALRSSLTAAAAAVSQTEARLIAIINQFMATLAAIGPNIIFPWGWAAVVSAATDAVTQAVEAMTELQSELSGQTAQVTEAGRALPVTEAPTTAATSAAQSAAPAAASSSGGSQGLSALMNSFSQAAQQGTQTASQLASQLAGTGAKQGVGDPLAAATPAITPAAAGLAHASGGGGAGGGGAGGGSALGATTLAARSAPPVPPVSEDAARAIGPARTGAGLTGTPMMGSPMAPMAHGAGARPGGHHTAPAFLHTTDHGDEILGDLGTAAPPVIGEAEPVSTRSS